MREILKSWFCGSRGIIRHLEAFRGNDEQWYWHAVAWNGERIAHSEGYSTKAACEKTIDEVAKQLHVMWKFKEDAVR